MLVIGSDIRAILPKPTRYCNLSVLAANSSRTLSEFYQSFIRCFASPDQVVCSHVGAD